MGDGVEFASKGSDGSGLFEMGLWGRDLLGRGF